MNSGGGKKQYDHLIKLIIIGDSSVGKSCILLRFSEDHFPTSHMPTIGKYYCKIRSQNSPSRTEEKSKSSDMLHAFFLPPSNFLLFAVSLFRCY